MQSISWKSLVPFLVGTVVGALIMFTTFQGTEDAPMRSEVLEDSRSTTVVVGESTIDSSSEIASQSTSNHNDTGIGIVVDPASKPNTPPVYVELIGPTYEDVSFEDLHLTFSRQPRDEAWAFGVESEIKHYIANNNVAEWAEIEYVECRKSICEIAGYSHGETDYDAREILEKFSQSTWWYPSRSTHRMRGGSGDLKYFLVIATGLKFERRLRAPRVVE